MLMEIKNKFEFDGPPPLRTPAENRDRSKYCHFYRDTGLVTNDCKNLRKLLNGLAAKGKLPSHLIKGDNKQNKNH